MNEPMNPESATRRAFLLQMGGAAGAALLQAQWPAIVSAAQHAHQAVQSKQAAKFDVLTPEQAREVEAIAARIIPTDDLPGATEAGVVYFIDRALKTFASEARPLYAQGLLDINRMTSEMFPGVMRFSAATAAQQDNILSVLEKATPAQKDAIPRRPGVVSPDFLQTFWRYTIFGFLVDPEGGGNRDYVGWKVIGRDPAHSFSPPFGFYDQDYPGWQAAGPTAEKK